MFLIFFVCGPSYSEYNRKIQHQAIKGAGRAETNTQGEMIVPHEMGGALFILVLKTVLCPFFFFFL